MSARAFRPTRTTGAVDARPLPKPTYRRHQSVIVPLRNVLGDALLQRLVEAFARSLWKEYENATVRVDRVPMRGATPVAISVDADRLWRASELLWEYRIAQIEPYMPVLVRDRSATSWRLLLPPIIESHGDGQTSAKSMYVMDGMHRLHNLHQLAIGDAMALIISSPHLPPPPARTHDSWEEVWRAEAGTLRGEARFCWLSESLLRPVSQKIDRDKWELATVRGSQVFPTEFSTVEDCVRRAAEIFSVASGSDASGDNS
jgi:hypothetical protein